MDLPETLTIPVQNRLKNEAGLSSSNVEEIIGALNSNSPINWNLLLDKESEATGNHETDD